MNNLAEEDLELSEEAAEYGKESAKSRAMTFYPRKTVKAYLDTLEPGMKSDFINNLIEDFMTKDFDQRAHKNTVNPALFMALTTRVAAIEKRLEMDEESLSKLHKALADVFIYAETYTDADVAEKVKCRIEQAEQIRASAQYAFGVPPVEVWIAEWITRLKGSRWAD